ncbi:MAG: FmdE family protein [Polyangia bacterium]|nr:FmdE family protein [Polyangia bacterium]
MNEEYEETEVHEETPSEQPTMPSGLSKAQIQGAIAFHGHWCPGLAIGLRAAEMALGEVGASEDEEVVCVSETDMCAVDGIQAITGCTLGKGNLILADLGKVAFRFWRRRDGRGIRLRLRPEAMRDPDPELEGLRQRRNSGSALSPEEAERLEGGRAAMTGRIMAAPLDALFELVSLDEAPPGRAPRLPSLACALCGEPTMETRTRNLGGRTLCIPCFEKEGSR